MTTPQFVADAGRDAVALVLALHRGQEDTAGAILEVADAGDMCRVLAGMLTAGLRMLAAAAGVPGDQLDGCVEDTLTSTLRAPVSPGAAGGIVPPV